jgi:hypothetical protein
MGWWKQLWLSETKEWTHGWISDGTQPRTVVADAEYLTLSMRSIHIQNVRVGTTRYYGALHCFSSLLHNQNGTAEFHSFTTPNNLQGIDAKNADRVVTARETLLGPVPYRGGAVSVEAGVFAIAEANLAEPYLSLLAGLSSVVGVSYVNTGVGILKQLSSGIENVTKAGGNSTLEIGLATEFKPVMTGSYGVVRAARGSLDLAKLRIASDGRLERADGSLVSEPYLVLGIEAETQRHDWRTIPDLRAAYARVENAVRRGDVGEAEGAVSVLRTTLLLSPDLLDVDAQKIIAAVEKTVSAAMPTTKTSHQIAREFPTLDALTV